MAVETNKILCQRLAAARRELGLTQSQVAESLGVTQVYLSLLENGKRRPNLDLLAKLSACYARPVRWFYGEAEAPTGCFSVLLRHSETLSVPVRRGLRKFAEICDQIAELRHMLNLDSVGLCGYSIQPRAGDRLDDLAHEMARAERARLGLGDAACRDLADLLEAQGIPVVRVAIPDSKLAGAMAYDAEKGGFILVNAADPPGRQLWTVAHEYCHLLKDRETGFKLDELVSDASVEPPPRDAQFFTEYFANRFAKHFLLPQETVRRFVEEIWRRRIDATTLAELRRSFGVSYQALLIRLAEMGYLGEPAMARWSAAPLSGVERLLHRGCDEEPSALPSLVLWKLAFEAAQTGEITVSHCAELLAVSPMEIQDVLFELGDEG